MNTTYHLPPSHYLFDIRPILGASDNGTQGNRQNINERVVIEISGPRVLYLAKTLLNRIDYLVGHGFPPFLHRGYALFSLLKSFVCDYPEYWSSPICPAPSRHV